MCSADRGVAIAPWPEVTATAIAGRRSLLTSVVALDLREIAALASHGQIVQEPGQRLCRRTRETVGEQAMPACIHRTRSIACSRSSSGRGLRLRGAVGCMAVSRMCWAPAVNSGLRRCRGPHLQPAQCRRPLLSGGLGGCLDDAADRPQKRPWRSMTRVQSSCQGMAAASRAACACADSVPGLKMTRPGWSWSRAGSDFSRAGAAT